MLRFAALFILILVVLFTLQLMPVGQSLVVTPFTAVIADISATLLSAVDPGVEASGKIIQDRQSGFGVSIEAGCNGIEATIVLVAAILAFPSSLFSKLVGIAVGFLAIQLANLLRIVSLFYLGQWNQTVFEWAHLYVWQSLIILDVLIVFLVWMRFSSAHPLSDDSVPA
jgi:exosortase H (IPTLxxWG-CTERM-specific)